MAVDGIVYDLTAYQARHPGGVPKLLLGAGKDGTSLFHKYHTWINHKHLVGKLQVGFLERPYEN